MSNPEPTANSAVSKTKEAAKHIISIKMQKKGKEEEEPEEGNRYFRPGIIKVNNIGTMEVDDINEMLRKVSEELAKHENDQSYLDVNFIINVVKSVTNEPFGFAWVSIRESAPGNRMYNALIGKRLDGTDFPVIMSEDNEPIKQQVIKIKPLRMNATQIDRFWNLKQRDFTNQKTHSEYIEYENSYNDSIILRRLIAIIDAKNFDDDKFENLLNDYFDLIADRKDKGQDTTHEDEIEEFFNENGISKKNAIVLEKFLRKTSELISLCEIQIEPSFVKDPNPGDSFYHLVTSNLDLPGITPEDIRRHFAPFNTVEGTFTRTYAGREAEITGAYPHVWIQEIPVGRITKRIGHIAFSDDIGNYDARYAMLFLRKFNISLPQDKENVRTVFMAYYNEKIHSEKVLTRVSGYVPRERPAVPSRNPTLAAFTGAIKSKLASTSRKGPDMDVDISREEAVIPSVTNFRSKNPFDLLAGKPKPAESLWTSRPLPEGIKRGNEYTLSLNVEQAPVMPTVYTKRKYDSTRRDDGNLTRFF